MPLLDLAAPGVDFAASTHTGEPLPSFESLARGSWTLFFAFPRAFTPICSTEIKELLQLRPELERRNVRVVGLSTDTREEHADWLRDVERVAGAGHKVWFPVVSDVDGVVARKWGMLQLAGKPAGAEEVRDATGRPTCTRSVYVLNPDFEVAFVQVNPLNAGRNFAETLRVIDALQVTWAQDVVGTPASWQPGDRVVVLPRWPSSANVIAATATAPKRTDSRASSSASAAGSEEASSVADPSDAADMEPLVSAAQAAKAARAAASAAVAAATSSLSLVGGLPSASGAAPGATAATSGDVESVTPYLSFASIKPLFGRGMSSLSRAASTTSPSSGLMGSEPSPSSVAPPPNLGDGAWRERGSSGPDDVSPDAKRARGAQVEPDEASVPASTSS